MSEEAKKKQHQYAIEKRLRKLQVSVLERKVRVDSELRRESGPLPANFSEQAIAVESDEALLAIQRELQSQLDEIHHAQQRLRYWGYGICEHCGYEISPVRLQAIPSTSLCIDCASAASG